MQEVLKAKQAEVQLSLDDVPVLDGTLECLERKIFSSLHQDNSQVASTIQNTEAYSNNPFYELLFDPQTAGGLLASLPEKCASDCLSELRKNGYPYAAAIGRVSSVNAETPTIILK